VRSSGRCGPDGGGGDGGRRSHRPLPLRRLHFRPARGPRCLRRLAGEGVSRRRAPHRRDRRKPPHVFGSPEGLRFSFAGPSGRRSGVLRAAGGLSGRNELFGGAQERPGRFGPMDGDAGGPVSRPLSSPGPDILSALFLAAQGIRCGPGGSLCREVEIPGRDPPVRRSGNGDPRPGGRGRGGPAGVGNGVQSPAGGCRHPSQEGDGDAAGRAGPSTPGPARCRAVRDGEPLRRERVGGRRRPPGPPAQHLPAARKPGRLDPRGRLLSNAARPGGEKPPGGHYEEPL